MPIAFVRQPSVLVALLSGDVDLWSLKTHLPVLTDLCDHDDCDVVLDMAHVERLDATVADALNTLRRRLEGKGRELHIAATAPHIQAVLSKAQLQDVIIAA